VKKGQKVSKNRIKTLHKQIKESQIPDIFTRFAVFVFVAAIAVAVITFGRGYRFDLNTQTVSSTGILAISSTPENAQVYINGDLRGATDLNINLEPGTYVIEIKKEGYRSFQQTIRLKGEIVQAVDPILFPINPSLNPLTTIGVSKVKQVQSTDRFVIVSDSDDAEKNGIYLYEATDNPLDFLPPLSPILLQADIPISVDLQQTAFIFSPDHNEMIASFLSEDGEPVATYLLNMKKENTNVLDISTSKQALLDAWIQQEEKNRAKILETLPKDMQIVASDSFIMIKYSPDKTKFLYQADQDITIPRIIQPPLIGSNQTPEVRNIKKGAIYVYDRREDKNFEIDSPVGIEDMYWYTDSKRIVYREDGQISISLYDGEVRQTVYSGPLEQGFVAASPDGKILILANLNPISNKHPDLYQVGIQ